MNRKEKLPELLAPAGSYDCLVAAVAAGADAVYIGGKRFGARAYAKNFDTGELSRAVSYCHLNGVKLYVTLNTLIGDREMQDAVNYARELYLLGVDALIVADLGLIRELSVALPDMELHASTQMSVHNTLGADVAASLGVCRVVLARELSLENIRSVTEECRAEVEVFLHGALCVSHSGQCLFSSLVGGRSGNRGECAQPCRLPYKFIPSGASAFKNAQKSNTGGTFCGKSAACADNLRTASFEEGYPLSLKDLSLADHIPTLIESGVSSLKIEGRMKSPSYVYTVTSVYRRLLDECRAATPDEREALRHAFSRDGFTDGYFTGKIKGKMTGVRSLADKEISRASEGASYEILRHAVRAEVKIKLGAPSEMRLFDENRCVRVFGASARRAETAPLTAEGVKERLSKMGNTYLSLSTSDIELTLDEGVNLSPSEVNALRRSAAEKFEDFSRKDELSPYKYDIKSRRRPADVSGKFVTAQFFSEGAYLDALACDSAALSRLDAAFVPLFSGEDTLAGAKAIHLPPVILNSEIQEIRLALEKAKKCGVLYALVDNIGQIPLVKEFGFTVFGGFRLNITNGSADRAFLELGVCRRILSAELTTPQARDICGGVITYGRIPLMLTERCFMRENLGCASCGAATLVDRRGERFPVVSEFGHRNIILNSAVTYMGDKRDELSEIGLSHAHLLFTTERGSEIVAVLRAHERGAPLATGKISRRAGRRSTSR